MNILTAQHLAYRPTTFDHVGGKQTCQSSPVSDKYNTDLHHKDQIRNSSSHRLCCDYPHKIKYLESESGKRLADEIMSSRCVTSKTVASIMDGAMKPDVTRHFNAVCSINDRLKVRFITTPLFEAVRSENTDIVRCLIEKGGKEQLFVSCQVYAIFDNESGGIGKEVSLTPLEYAAATGKTEVLACLIELADVEAENLIKPLLWAIEYQQPEAVKLLISKGVDLNRRASRHVYIQEPPPILHSALTVGNPDVVAMLIDALLAEQSGTDDPRKHVNKFGCTALTHVADALVMDFIFRDYFSENTKRLQSFKAIFDTLVNLGFKDSGMLHSGFLSGSNLLALNSIDVFLPKRKVITELTDSLESKGYYADDKRKEVSVKGYQAILRHFYSDTADDRQWLNSLLSQLT